MHEPSVTIARAHVLLHTLADLTGHITSTTHLKDICSTNCHRSLLLHRIVIHQQQILSFQYINRNLRQVRCLGMSVPVARA